MSTAFLGELDEVTARPNWLGPTVIADGKVGLLVDAVALYWGVRRLLFDHTSNQRAVGSLHTMIEGSWKRRKAAGLVDTIEARKWRGARNLRAFETNVDQRQQYAAQAAGTGRDAVFSNRFVSSGLTPSSERFPILASAS